MKRILICILVVIIQLVISTFALSAGKLQIRVVAITASLELKSVPAAQFTIIKDGADNPISITTDLDGKSLVELASGTYCIKSAKPVSYLGRSLTWEKAFTIADDAVTSLDLTSNDATTTEVKQQSSRQFDEAAELYKRLKTGVVAVESDTGHGTGFIVGPNLVMTNNHVVEGSISLRVRFTRGMKVNAVLLCSDKDHDIALVGVDTSAFGDVSILSLAMRKEGEPLALEGERVVAIGFPLNQDKIITSGIISKVESGAIISDVNINHGNSGGPLLNLAGEVIGVTTFGDMSSSGGPGISGIVPITPCLSLIDVARQKLGESKLPLPALLPDVPVEPYPVDALNAASDKDLKPLEIKAPKNFQTLIFTPATIESLATAQARRLAKTKKARDNKRDTNGVKDTADLNGHKLWEQYVGANRAVVQIIVQPVLKDSTSTVTRILGALARVRLPEKLNYRDDFYRMELWRGDKLVEPIYPYRQRISVDFDGYMASAQDTAYAGVYFYDPSAFDPSAPVKIRVVKESNTTKYDEYAVSSKMQKIVWDDFELWRSNCSASQKP